MPAWISGIGTFLTVVVALFSKAISDWLRRPMIKIDCPSNSVQCKEKKGFTCIK